MTNDNVGQADAAEESTERDDVPAWERLIPSEWLSGPHFRDDSDNWISSVKDIIEHGRLEKRLPEKALTDDEENELRRIVARYIKDRVDWDGFLSKGDRHALQRVKKDGERLLTSMRKLATATSAGAGDPELHWYLKQTLVEPHWERSLIELESLLRVLSSLDTRSPRSGSDKENTGSWLSPTSAGVRAQLQGRIDEWWSRVAGLSKAKSEVKAPAYHDFLRECFGRIRLSDAPGYSEGAVADARREFESRQQSQQADAKRLREVLNSLARKRALKD